MDANSNLKIIEEMLYTARKEVKDNGAFFLLWGWLVFIAALGQYALHLLGWDKATLHISSSFIIEIDGLTWLILMPLGGVLSILLSKKQQREERVRTWFDEVMKYLWIAFGAVLFIILFTMGYQKVNLFPLIIALYGLGLFITGGVLKFRPLLFGGIISWVIAMVSIFLTGEYVTLCLALSVLTGYIVPGYMLQKQWRAKENVQAA
jgi:hypothetical protein